MRKARNLAAGIAIVMACAVSGALVAQEAGKPVKLSTGKPFGAAQTSSTITDPQVDGKVLRVVVAAAEKPWHAGINTFINEKVSAGDRIKATLWLRASSVEPGETAMVEAVIRESDPPATAYGKPARLKLTDRFAPYVIEGTATKASPAFKVTVAMHLGFARQTVDIAAVQAVKLPPAPQP